MKLEGSSKETVKNKRHKEEVNFFKFGCEARDLRLWCHAVNFFDTAAVLAIGQGFNPELKNIGAAALEQKAICLLKLCQLSFAKRAFKEARDLYVELDDGTSIARVNKELKVLLSFDELSKKIYE